MASQSLRPLTIVPPLSEFDHPSSSLPPSLTSTSSYGVSPPGTFPPQNSTFPEGHISPQDSSLGKSSPPQTTSFPDSSSPKHTSSNGSFPQDPSFPQGPSLSRDPPSSSQEPASSQGSSPPEGSSPQDLHNLHISSLSSSHSLAYPSLLSPPSVTSLRSLSQGFPSNRPYVEDAKSRSSLNVPFISTHSFSSDHAFPASLTSSDHVLSSSFAKISFSSSKPVMPFTSLVSEPNNLQTIPTSGPTPSSGLLESLESGRLSHSPSTPASTRKTHEPHHTTFKTVLLHDFNRPSDSTTSNIYPVETSGATSLSTTTEASYLTEKSEPTARTRCSLNTRPSGASNSTLDKHSHTPSSLSSSNAWGVDSTVARSTDLSRHESQTFTSYPISTLVPEHTAGSVLFSESGGSNQAHQSVHEESRTVQSHKTGLRFLSKQLPATTGISSISGLQEKVHQPTLGIDRQLQSSESGHYSAGRSTVSIFSSRSIASEAALPTTSGSNLPLAEHESQRSGTVLSTISEAALPTSSGSSLPLAESQPSTFLSSVVNDGKTTILTNANPFASQETAGSNTPWITALKSSNFNDPGTLSSSSPDSVITPATALDKESVASSGHVTSATLSKSSNSTAPASIVHHPQSSGTYEKPFDSKLDSATGALTGPEIAGASFIIGPYLDSHGSLTMSRGTSAGVPIIPPARVSVTSISVGPSSAPENTAGIPFGVSEPLVLGTAIPSSAITQSASVVSDEFLGKPVITGSSEPGGRGTASPSSAAFLGSEPSAKPSISLASGSTSSSNVVEPLVSGMFESQDASSTGPEGLLSKFSGVSSETLQPNLPGRPAMFSPSGSLAVSEPHGTLRNDSHSHAVSSEPSSLKQTMPALSAFVSSYSGPTLALKDVSSATLKSIDTASSDTLVRTVSASKTLSASRSSSTGSNGVLRNDSSVAVETSKSISSGVTGGFFPGSDGSVSRDSTFSGPSITLSKGPSVTSDSFKTASWSTPGGSFSGSDTLSNSYGGALSGASGTFGKGPGITLGSSMSTLSGMEDASPTGRDNLPHASSSSENGGDKSFSFSEHDSEGNNGATSSGSESQFALPTASASSSDSSGRSGFPVSTFDGSESRPAMTLSASRASSSVDPGLYSAASDVSSKTRGTSSSVGDDALLTSTGDAQFPAKSHASPTSIQSLETHQSGGDYPKGPGHASHLTSWASLVSSQTSRFGQVDPSEAGKIASTTSASTFEQSHQSQVAGGSTTWALLDAVKEQSATGPSDPTVTVYSQTLTAPSPWRSLGDNTEIRGVVVNSASDGLKVDSRTHGAPASSISASSGASGDSTGSRNSGDATRLVGSGGPRTDNLDSVTSLPEDHGLVSPSKTVPNLATLESMDRPTLVSNSAVQTRTIEVTRTFTISSCAPHKDCYSAAGAFSLASQQDGRGADHKDVHGYQLSTSGYELPLGTDSYRDFDKDQDCEAYSDSCQGVGGDGFCQQGRWRAFHKDKHCFQLCAKRHWLYSGTGDYSGGDGY
ncbi:hypothetical protein CDD82_5263 [Ophiocordyceps australis]|uniref:Uncharacterized protein n=1 Tax=Ophiocordyceps australis TaxID=1399860 RepID=A0A2C5Y6W9_9HYPO|nr:hypothetical protein CDD82_5263 [Ophiocordyceps australis]